MKDFVSITVFAVAVIGFVAGQIMDGQAPPLDRTFGKQAPVARQMVPDKPPVDRQDDPANAEMILGAVQDALDSCGPVPSWINDPWVNVPAQESAKRWALGCMNLPPQPEGAKRRDSRNLGPTFLANPDPPLPQQHISI